jgi:alpha-L-rhamnosidase
VTEWIYDTLVGIKADESAPGFTHFLLRPACGGGLTYAQGSYLSVSGLIRSAWNAENNVMTAYRCAVPANTTATLYLPAQSADDVTESGKPLTEAEGITVVSSGGGTVELLLNSGAYDFLISVP